ncbi:hypothetical protein PINS_up015186 [Pythium insidiosum]|nr:hypothetical protein PINS_up015186 [Pythium insidiosum]
MDELHAMTFSRVLRSPTSGVVSLVLSNVPLRTRSIVALASALCPGQSRLEVLVLESCEIGSIGASAIAEALAHNNRLWKLDLSRNHIGDSACPWLCNALLNNETLRVRAFWTATSCVNECMNR